MSINSHSNNSEILDYIEIPNKEIFEQSELSQIMTYEEFLSSSSTNEEVPISSLAYLMSENEKKNLKVMMKIPRLGLKRGMKLLKKKFGKVFVK
jgi:hypothetical protein